MDETQLSAQILARALCRNAYAKDDSHAIIGGAGAVEIGVRIFFSLWQLTTFPRGVAPSSCRS
jgi:hypothetical protein